MIKATKNGMVREFSNEQWEILGSDKYGWVPEPAVPKEVAAVVAGTEDTPKQKPGRKPKQNAT